MIKFFRKIRQHLLSENKFSKYLLYAIGEIVLVVIGIIIALQLNNWNESRKTFNDELRVYSKLMNDLSDEFRNTNNEIEYYKYYQDVHYHVYSETKGIATFDSTVDYNSLQWIFPYHLNISEKYTNSLVSITSDNIRDKLKYYITIEKGTKDAYDEWNELKVHRLRPFFRKHGIHKTENAFNDRPYIFDSLMDIELISHSKLKELYGTIELDELLFELRFKTSWILHNLARLERANKELDLALKHDLELYNITDWKNQDKYAELINEADIFYESKDYQKSADKYKDAFDQLEGKALPNDRYNAACSYALAEDTEAAFYHLFRLANDSYFNDSEYITTDSDLDILHNDKRWNKLMAIVKSKKEDVEK